MVKLANLMAKMADHSSAAVIRAASLREPTRVPDLRVGSVAYLLLKYFFKAALYVGRLITGAGYRLYANFRAAFKNVLQELHHVVTFFLCMAKQEVGNAAIAADAPAGPPPRSWRDGS